jgi:hypothetical protein
LLPSWRTRRKVVRVARRLLIGVVAFAAAALLAASARTTAPAQPSARVGAYYFDGWSGPLSNFHFEGLAWPGRNGQFPGRRPLSGWRDDSLDAMEAQLRWAHADGIGFFVFDWFYNPNPGNGPINMAHDNYLKLADHHGVGYALAYVNQDPFGIPPTEWAGTVDRWVTGDFSNPDYVRIAGKPLLVILDTTLFRQQMGGSAGVNQAIDTLQLAARRHGLPGVFVVGDRGIDWVNIPCFPVCEATDGGPNGLVTEHYDALSEYTDPLVVEPRAGARPYDDAVSATEQAWNRIAQGGPFPYIPSVMSGWDPRPPDEEFFGTTLEWFTRTPDDVGAFLRDAINWVGAHPAMRVEPAPAPPVVLLYAWNELGEDGYVLPTDEAGYSYGKAIAQAMGIDWTPPPKHILSVTPSARGTVVSTPAGISCPRTCAAAFDEGLQITLTAQANRGSLPDHWTGCTDTDPTCSVVLLGDSTVRPVFLATVQRRRLSLRLRGHLVAAGSLGVIDGFSGCMSYQQVQVQRREGNGWVSALSTWTDGGGRYSIKLPDRGGTYRAHALHSSFQGHTCLSAVSGTVKHSA